MITNIITYVNNIYLLFVESNIIIGKVVRFYDLSWLVLALTSTDYQHYQPQLLSCPTLHYT